MNEVTIDLPDLFRKLSRKWILIVCAGLICALLAGAYGYSRALHAEQSALEQHERYAAAAPELPGYFNKDLFCLREGLSENSAAFAEAFAGVYRGFLEQYRYTSDEITHPENAESYMMFLDAYKDVVSVMGGTQREYYEGLITAITENGSRDRVPVEPYEASAPSVIQPRWIFIGILAGIFLSCAIIVLPYLFTKKLRCVKDLEYAFGIPVLGVISGKGDEELKLFASRIQVLMQKNAVKSVFLWGSGDKTSERIRDRLRQSLSSSGAEKILCCDSMPQAEIMGAIADVDAVVLVEKTGASHYEDIHRETQTCNMLQIRLLGSIVSE